MIQTSPDYDFIAKILILGESGVGKTCLWLRYCERQFIPNYKCTIGKSHDFYSTPLTL